MIIKKVLKPIIIAVLLVMIFSCASYSGTLYENKYLTLEYNSIDVKVFDERDSIDHRSIDIPIITYGNEHDTITPSIDLENVKVLLQWAAYRHRQVTEENYYIEVFLKNGVQEFRSKGMTEQEYVNVELLVKVYKNEDREFISEAIGKADGTKKSLDASNENIETMFNVAIVFAFFDALEKAGLAVVSSS